MAEVCHCAAPARTAAGRAVTRRTATAAAARVMATAARHQRRRRARAGRPARCPRRGRPRTGRRWPATRAGRAPPRSRRRTPPRRRTEPRTWLGVAPSSHSRASSVRRWAHRGRQGVEHHDRREQRDHPDDHVVEQVDDLGALVGHGQRAVVDADQHQRADGRRGEDDDRGQHAAEQVGTPPGVGERELPRRAGPAGGRLRQRGRPAHAAPGRGWPGRRETRMPLLPEVAMASYGSSGVRGHGDRHDRHARRRTPRSSSAMATRHHGSRGRPAVASASASGAGPRVARRPAIDAATSAVSDHRERGGAERRRAAAELDGRRDHATVAQRGEEQHVRRRRRARHRPPPATAETTKVSARTRRRAWRGVLPMVRSSPISTPRWRTVMPMRGGEGEQHDRRAPAADDGAHDHEVVVVLGRDRAGRGLDQGGERADQRGAEAARRRTSR